MKTNGISKRIAALKGVCGKAKARFALNGVRIAQDGSGYVAEATDGRIACRVRGTGSVPQGLDVILPAKDLPAIAKTTRDSFTLTCENGRYRAHGSDGSICGGERIDGKFPDMTAIMGEEAPADPVASFWFNPAVLAPLLTALGRLAPMASGCGVRMDFYGKDRAIQLTATAPGDFESVRACFMPVIGPD